MSNDVSADLTRSLVENMRRAGEEWSYYKPGEIREELRPKFA